MSIHLDTFLIHLDSLGPWPYPESRVEKPAEQGGFTCLSKVYVKEIEAYASTRQNNIQNLNN